jgi:hypothetical protein
VRTRRTAAHTRSSTVVLGSKSSTAKPSLVTAMPAFTAFGTVMGVPPTGAITAPAEVVSPTYAWPVVESTATGRRAKPWLPKPEDAPLGTRLASRGVAVSE